MWTRQGDLYSLIRKKKDELGSIPTGTCPDIDAIIDTLEKLRTDNAKLRELGIEWYEYCEELANESDKTIKELEDEIEELQSENKDLQEHLSDLQGEISELEAEAKY